MAQEGLDRGDCRHPGADGGRIGSVSARRAGEAGVMFDVFGADYFLRILNSYRAFHQH